MQTMISELTTLMKTEPTAVYGGERGVYIFETLINGLTCWLYLDVHERTILFHFSNEQRDRISFDVYFAQHIGINHRTLEIHHQEKMARINFYPELSIEIHCLDLSHESSIQYDALDLLSLFWEEGKRLDNGEQLYERNIGDRHARLRFNEKTGRVNICLLIEEATQADVQFSEVTNLVVRDNSLLIMSNDIQQGYLYLGDYIHLSVDAQTRM